MKQHLTAAVRHAPRNHKPAVELELPWTTMILIGLLGAMFLLTNYPA